MRAAGAIRAPGPRSQWSSTASSQLRARKAASATSHQSIRAPSWRSSSRTSSSMLSGRPPGPPYAGRRNDEAMPSSWATVAG
jgi:hypothetical protein